MLLNKAGEQKVFSIFLFGQSGIGKTEVARILADGLEKEAYFAKINFQNYDRQDAVNSLIGSPRGYIGSQQGELGDKIARSNLGILLCDEFDKANRPVHNFFLELLEEGIFTDSLGREYDLNGYIIIFTSNIISTKEYKDVIPNELQTRFDLVAEFQSPTSEDKVRFVDLLIEQSKLKFPDKFSGVQLSANDLKMLHDFGYLGQSALRDIRKLFYQNLVAFFELKGI
jgi:ATP-dependent Clp protease ATP-binding subunit ClpA